MSKLSIIILVSILWHAPQAFSLPLEKGAWFRVQIPNEYIVQTHGEKIEMDIKRKIGKNLFLIKSYSKSVALALGAVPNYRYYGDLKDVEASSPNDINFDKQFHHQMIQTTKAWEVTQGSAEIIIAVTDNEFQLDHEDMKNVWWTNPSEIPNNGVDDDKNGYIDDVNGWDFIFRDNNVDDKEESTHGTHVSGTIVSNANNKLGGAGIAPLVKIMPLKWYDYDEPFTSAVIAETYHYAVDNGAKIISTSYNVDGMIDDEAYLAAVAYARKHNVLIFNSAGNTGTQNPPRQKIEDIILVCSVMSGAKMDQDYKSSFSNYGTGIDICAPGDPIYAPIQNLFGGVQNKYGELQGTSMATPVVAAVAALIWSAHPNFTDEEVRQRLFDSSFDLNERNPEYKNQLGAGRVDAYSAVQ